MHPFPPASKLHAFLGDAIIQVWLDPHGVRFIFESGKELYAETKVLHAEPDGTLWSFDGNGENGAPVVFHRLLYKRIIRVEREEFRLTLKIDNGSALTIHSELSPFESGHLNMGGGDFIVF
jgi:hypothetical protein